MGRIFCYWRGSGSVCDFGILCMVIFHVTITQMILVPMPQLILIQQLYSVPSRTHYFCDISRFPHWPWSIILCVHRISHFKTALCVRAGHMQLFVVPVPFPLFCVDLVLPNLGQISVFFPSVIQLARLLLYFVVLSDN